MVWAIFLNNQTVKQAFLLPNGQVNTYRRYIFIEGRNIPIIFTDEKSTGPRSWAVGVDDGTNPHYQLQYEGEGKIQITLEVVNSTLQYIGDSGFTKVTKTL